MEEKKTLTMGFKSSLASHEITRSIQMLQRFNKISEKLYFYSYRVYFMAQLVIQCILSILSAGVNM